ncbi:Two component regulator propeller [Aquisphaera giovannonii]|uniref:Two component regulator propeller n=1 Tax=Aquisphaera giovannonii TaxID=406548 RepID=A0A5B9VY74_9BACT|nr:hypothetical protein [Aquisphaera giovannonii]QEH33258.1 Two component regulator propeller [Aquisphaera giovannonii]
MKKCPIFSLITAAVGLAAALSSPALAKLETWRQEGSAVFARHRRERVVISDQGRVRLGRELVPAGTIAAERVWDLARGSDGTVYAATGDGGKVFRGDGKAGSPWALALATGDGEVLSVAATPDGRVFAGTGPGGQVVEVTGQAHRPSRPDPRVRYIWDLAADADGSLYAATGPTGQLWKLGRDGKWTLLLDSKAGHLLSVAVSPDGTVYAGSDGEGLIYRVGRDGKASVVYDAPQSDIRTLAVAADGTLYAGTAAEASGGASRLASFFSAGVEGSDAGTTPGGSRDAAPGIVEGRLRADRGPTAGSSSRTSASPEKASAGTASPKPVLPGDNAVYRVDTDGVVREIFRAKALIFALCCAGDRLMVGTGPDGQLFEIRDRGAESTPLAKLDSGQILSLLAEPDGGILLGTGDPASLVRLSSRYVPRGEIVSEVHDAKLRSRFGALAWRGETPPGTTISFQVRSGNVGEPDETWSAWSAEQTLPGASRAEAPAGRFVQYRARLVTSNTAATPELASVALSYRSINLPPEINRLDVPDVSVADGSARQVRLNVRWEASDPNDDDLAYTVQVRKEGWPSWITLTESPTAEKAYNWDTTAFPSGTYRIRLAATDRPSNREEDAASRDRESSPFLVDHEPPTVAIRTDAGRARIVLSDGATRVTKAEYALDGGPWTPLFPEDGLFDTLREEISLPLPELKPGVHLLMVRGTDAAGNVGSKDALITGKD